MLMIHGCHPITWSSRRPRGQRPPSHQVVRRRGEGDDPIDLSSTAMPKLPQQPDGLHPAEGLLDLLPTSLADRVARMAGGARIDRTATIGRVLRDMRRDTHLSHG